MFLGADNPNWSIYRYSSSHWRLFSLTIRVIVVAIWSIWSGHSGSCSSHRRGFAAGKMIWVIGNWVHVWTSKWDHRYGDKVAFWCLWWVKWEKKESESDLLVALVGWVAIIVRAVAGGDKLNKSNKWQFESLPVPVIWFLNLLLHVLLGLGDQSPNYVTWTQVEEKKDLPGSDVPFVFTTFTHIIQLFVATYDHKTFNRSYKVQSEWSTFC